jgi:Flp pilus assembly pilin Flp
VSRTRKFCLPPASSGVKGRTLRPPDQVKGSSMTDILMRPVVRLQIAIAELREREDGQTTTEYAILLGFLAIAIIIALFFLRNVLRGLFSDAASSVSNSPGG